MITSVKCSDTFQRRISILIFHCFRHAFGKAHDRIFIAMPFFIVIFDGVQRKDFDHSICPLQLNPCENANRV